MCFSLYQDFLKDQRIDIEEEILLLGQTQIEQENDTLFEVPKKGI